MYWYGQALFTAIDLVLFTTLVIYSSIVLFSDEAQACRREELHNFWYYVAFCCLVGALYSLALVGICLLTCFCFCYVLAMFCRQRQFRMQEAINRVPLAQAAMSRIGATAYN